MNSLQWFRQAVEKFCAAGIRFPEKEAEEMLSHFGINRVALYRDNPEIREPELLELNNFLQRRLSREPLQYILGYTYFFDLKIKTRIGVLIPRPETELLVMEAIKEAKALDSERPHILDLCTGSGCIAIAIARALSSAAVYGIDISQEAIDLAITNAEINNVKNVIFLRGDLFEPLKNRDIKFDIITANPPYVRSDEIPFLEPEVRDWEPREALDGGKDGLNYYRRIFEELTEYIKPGGWLMLELGQGLYKELISLAKLYKFKGISVLKDLSGIERVLKCQIEVYL